MQTSTALTTEPRPSSPTLRSATAARSSTSSSNVYDTIWQGATDAASRKVAFLKSEDDVLDERLVNIEGRSLVNFGSCSYLGLQREPSILQGIEDATRRFGSQFSSSRAYLSISQYTTLEQMLDEIFERPTIACPSTTLGHMSALPVLIKDDDAVILDQQVHHSVQTAAQLVKARGVPLHIVRHNRMDRLEALVEKLSAKHDRVWILVDGVYSMYGDVAPVHELVDLLDRHRKAWLYADDAHGMGWAGRHGRGYVRSQIDHHERMVLATSLNKSFAAAGGVLVFPNAELRDRVRGCGPTMIFSGPIQPPMLGAAIASARLHMSPAIEEAQAELQGLVEHTNRRIAELGLPQVDVTDTPLFFIPTGLPRLVNRVVRGLMDDGFFLNTATFPAVPMPQGGIRFTVHRGIRIEDIDAMLERLAYHHRRVLAVEGSSLEEVVRTFRRTGIVLPDASPRQARLQPVREAGLRLRHAGSIREVEPQWWDARMAGRGPMTHAALTMMEKVFTDAPDPEQQAELGYVWVEDEEGRVVLSTMYSVCLIKEDMFARAEISEKLEAIRRDGDPHFLVAKAVVLGTPLSLGEHLRIDREHPKWTQALAQLLEHLQGVKQQAGASQILLRDFAMGDEVLRTTMLELGFFEHRLPDLMQITDMQWNDRRGYLASLGGKYRYNVRKEAIAYEDRFIVETSKDCSDEMIQQCYDLYRAVHARSVELNVFPLPFELFRAAFDHPEYDIIRLHLKSDPERPVAVLLSHRTEDLYAALVVGLDDETLYEHKTYKQILFQCVERARALGATRMNLAFTAELEKKKLGARPQPTCAFIQMDDDYSAVVMESL